MAISWQELAALDTPTNQDVIASLEDETTIGDYVLDAFRAPIGGASRAVQGLLQLGALPIDYALDTNLTKNIDNLFNKLGEYTDAETSLGKLTQTLVQYGLPLGVASKVGSGMRLLRNAGQINKLSDIKTPGGKAAELARRAGYFGAIGGATDLAVSVTGRDQTASEVFGLTEEVNLDNLSGRERAGEALKQKLRFGAEGTIIGGAIPLLPTAATTVGSKLLGPLYGKVIAPVGGAALRALDSAVVNPLSKAIAGTGERGGIASLVARKGGGLLDTALDKTGLPASKEWKLLPENTSTFTKSITKTLDWLKDNFTTGGALTKNMKTEQDRIVGKLTGKAKTLKSIDTRINETLGNFVTKFKTNIYDNLVKSPEYHNIQDALNIEKNKIYDYIKAASASDQIKTLNLVNPLVRKEAKQLKQILKESNTAFGELLAKSSQDSHKALADMLIKDADNYLKQRFAAYNNRSYQFDIDGPVAQGALKEMKKVVLRNADVRASAGPESAKLAAGDIKGLVSKLDSKDGLKGVNAALDSEITALAKNRVNLLKKAVINAGDNPELFFGNISKYLKLDYDKLRPGENFPDAIKRFLSTPKGQTVPVKDYALPILETVTYNAKQTYKKRYFDLVEREWLSNGLIFRNEEEAIARGIDPTQLQNIGSMAKGGKNRKGEIKFITTADGKTTTDFIGESNLFTKDYLTKPEIANAVLETKTTFDDFFNNAWYNNIMQLKAAGQIAKTIFSPMTQIRNVTTASFFPLASGLIGSRVSLADSWKMVAEDIFQGAKVNLDDLNREIDDLVTRKVIDQNVQIGEIKNILDQANKGKISFNSFMSNPTVQKLVDIYQGGDNIWKIYSDRFYRSALKEAFGDPGAVPDQVLANVKDWYRTVAKEDFIDFNILTGKAKTADEALKDVSAYLVTNTIPTYSNVPKFIQELRKLPLGNFVAFPAEIIRTGANLMTIGARELTSTNPYIRQMGARRLIGTSATFGGIGAVVSEAAQYFTGVDEETMDRAKRSFIPLYERNSTLIPVSAPGEDGKFKYINFSYSNPYDTLVRPVNAILNAYGNGTLNKESADEIVYKAFIGDQRNPGAVSELLNPFMSESISTERLADVTFRNGETRQGKRIYFPDDNMQTRIARSIEHIFAGLQPGAYTSARRIWEGATGTFTDSGTARNTLDEVTALLSGVRVQEVKPLASMPFIITSFAKDNRNIGSKFSRKAYGVNSSPEQRVSAFKENILDSFISQKRLYQTIQDAEALGISTSDLRNILTDRLKNKDQVSRLLRGEFKVPNFSRARFDSTYKRLSSEDEVAAETYKDTAMEVMSIYRDMQREAKGFDLESATDQLDNDIESLLRPDLPELRSLPIRPRGGVAPTPTAVELPAPVFPQGTAAVQPQQPLGQRFNIAQDPRFNILFPRG